MILFHLPSSHKQIDFCGEAFEDMDVISIIYELLNQVVEIMLIYKSIDVGKIQRLIFKPGRNRRLIWAIVSFLDTWSER